MKKKRKHLLYILLFMLLWCIIVQIIISKTSFESVVRIFRKLDARKDIEDFFNKAPVLRDRLVLIDEKVLGEYNKQSKIKHEDKSCVFCSVEADEPITFALLCPSDIAVEEHILLPVLKAWEIGFWVEQIISSAPKKFASFSTYHSNLPLGFILQRVRSSVVLEIVLLHEREGDFWWHGALSEDDKYEKKLSNIKLLYMKETFKLNSAGALNKFQFESVDIDKINLNIPVNVESFLNESSQSKFIECNYERADKFYRMYGKDISPLAKKFTHKTWKLLSTVKIILEKLKIPFWLSSGTCLGFYRQCGIIPYSNDVDIGIFITDYSYKIISEFKLRDINLIHKFGRINDSLELSFIHKKLKLDIFFFYEDEHVMWNGGHKILWKNGKIDSGVKYKFSFPKFSLCWTEFLDLKVRIPCDTEAYIQANYGPDWFHPNADWSWRTSPFNVKENGVWRNEEVNEVLVMYKRL